MANPSLPPDEDRLIITAASAAFGPSLLALLGSLNLNWPDHPPVQVYDLGLDERTRAALGRHHIPARTVPPFVPHWRKHFTWKIWCWNDAAARRVLWLDAGFVVLQPMDEVFDELVTRDYFILSTGRALERNASAAACRGCGVPPEFRRDKATLGGGFFGFKKEGRMQEVLGEALRVARTEEHLAATEPEHRHDQALLSLLLYKYFGSVAIMDNQVYAEWKSPCENPRQKTWHHRRALRAADVRHFAAHLSGPAHPHRPRPPRTDWRFGRFYRVWKRKLFPRRAVYDGVRD